MEDARLFRVPSSYAMSLRLGPNGGWTLVIDRKFEGEPWRLDDRSVYEDLSLLEATEVVTAEVFVVRT